MNINSVEELAAFIADKLEGDYDYNTHVEAIAEITLAAHNLAASKLGASGFSASCAELLFLAKSRRMEGPFAIISANDMLYPQYSLADKVDDYLDSWLPWASEEAKRKLAETPRDQVADSVWQRWLDLAELSGE